MTKMITTDELHAFVIGAAETFCPWPARYKINKSVNLYIQSEYHYYLAGRGTGFLALLLILIALAKLIKEVLL